MTRLVSQLEEVKYSIITTIETLIANDLGVKHPIYNDTVLDLRCFGEQGREDKYPLEVLFADEILFADNRSIEFISAKYAYDKNGNQYSIFDVIESSIGQLCPSARSCEIATTPKNVFTKCASHIIKFPANPA
jgi:hypothetical protein